MQKSSIDRPCWLFSWAFLRKRPKFAEFVSALAPAADVMIDSGAFTNYTESKRAAAKAKAHVPITLRDYNDAVKRHFHGRVWQYVQLDVVGDHEASLANLRETLHEGLEPMAVWVMGAPEEYLPELVAHNRYLCVAGGVKTRIEYAAQRYQRAHEATGGRAMSHALGFARFPECYQLPVHSFDTSSWCSGAKYGGVYSFTDRIKGAGTLREILAAKDDRLAWLLRCGFTLPQLLDPAFNKGMMGVPAQSGAYAHVMLQKQAAGQGRRYFLALINQLQIYQVAATHAYSSRGGFDARAVAEEYRAILAMPTDAHRLERVVQLVRGQA